ncbi:MAG: disulfide bond formation protein B [Actinomycetota bacterium]
MGITDMSSQRAVALSRLINIVALLGLLGVLAGSLHLQFGIGEQPCPLCLVQRSGMIGLAVGPVMNLLWGIRARHYAISILAAFAGGAGSVRQILLHIQPGDPGYGPAFLGWHLYTWAFVTFAIGAAGCALLLMWQTPLDAGDTGVMGQRGAVRALSLFVVAFVFLVLLVIAVSIIPECGLGMCPDDPPNITGAGDIGGWIGILVVAAVSAVVALVLNRKLPEKPTRA